MIKIEKTNTIPTILLNQGQIETEKLKAAYLSAPDAYKNGTKTFDIKKSIYGHLSVKKSLRLCQYEKCCFCERKIEVGDVEHYRGKKAYQQDEQEPLKRPGYYWLAYTWSNLLLSCAVCNRSFKRSYFPLAHPKNRAVSHLDDLTKEEPLIIHPSIDEPEDFIEFRGHHLRAIHGNLKGKATIKRIGLDRPFIDERRRDHYLIMKKIFFLSKNENLSKIKRLELLKIVQRASEKDKEYASMIRWGLHYEFQF